MGGSTWLLHLEADRDGSPFTWQPGQHVAVRPAHAVAEDPLWLSIASAPDPARPGMLQLLVGLPVGSPRLAWLARTERGEAWTLWGPLGSFAPPPPAHAPLLLVGMGTGVAPLRAVLEEALRRHAGPPMTLLLGARHAHRLWFHDEFEHWSTRHPRFRYLPTVSRAGAGWSGRRGRVQAHLSEALSGLEAPRAMVCGTPKAVEEVRDALLAHGLLPGRIRVEGH